MYDSYRKKKFADEVMVDKLKCRVYEFVIELSHYEGFENEYWEWII